jgi:small subunit ribosomal protein S1
MTTINGIPAFLPVSQLTPEHYPRVEGGAVQEILTRLKEFIGQKLKVKIITADEKEEKLIISEKEATLEKEKKKITSLKVGDIVEGEISGITDFGAFMRFDHLEGLIHISELAWQLIEDPRDIVKVGQKVKAEIIGLDGTKIFLSLKKLVKDPWKTISKKYKVGQIVLGKITKIHPFGVFVQLDKDIHGLVHISELSSKKIKSPDDVVKVGQKRKFKILSIEPEEHRMGLSLKAVEEVKKEEKSISSKSTKSSGKIEKLDKKVKSKKDKKKTV